MSVKVQERNSWLFPVMVFAAAGMVAFGCIGIVAISAALSRDSAANKAFVSAQESPVMAQPDAAQPSPAAGEAKLTSATVTPGLKPPKTE